MSDFDESGYMVGRPRGTQRWAELFKDVPRGRHIIEGAVPPGVLVVKNFLTPQWCDALARECDGIEGEKLTVGEASADSDVTFEHNANRVTEGIIVEKLKADVTGVVKEAYVSIVEPHFKAKVEWIEKPEILRYRQGGEFKPHADSELWNASTKKWTRVLDRDLSILIYLNEGFEGGELVFPNFDFGLKPTRGLLVAFPSDGRYAHWAKPVTSGVRYSIVCWAAVKGSARVQDRPRTTLIRM